MRLWILILVTSMRASGDGSCPRCKRDGFFKLVERKHFDKEKNGLVSVYVCRRCGGRFR